MNAIRMDEYKKSAKKGLQKLEQIEVDLQQGETYLSITRLIVLKKLCKNQIAKRHFAKCLCDITYKACKGDKSIGKNMKSLIEQTLQLMESILVHNGKYGKPDYPNQLKKKIELIYNELTNYQNQTRSGHYGIQIRTITNMNLFIVELGIKCFLFEDERAGYELGRHFSEKYNASYGTGLIPESLSNVQNIIRFWKNYLNS